MSAIEELRKRPLLPSSVAFWSDFGNFCYIFFIFCKV